MRNLKALSELNQKLENFNLFNLDMLEDMQYEHHIKYMPKIEALQVIINTVEGDFTQLSNELAEIAQEQVDLF